MLYLSVKPFKVKIKQIVFYRINKNILFCRHIPYIPRKLKLRSGNRKIYHCKLRNSYVTSLCGEE